MAQREVRLANGTVIAVLDSDEKKTSTLGNYEEWLLARRDPTTNCLRDYRGSAWPGEEVIGNERLLGLRIVMISKGGRRLGYAPEANCELFKSEWTIRDQKRGTELVSIVFGQPDERLFSVPDRYREVPPSQLRGYSKGSDRALKVDLNYLKAHKALLALTASGMSR